MGWVQHDWEDWAAALPNCKKKGDELIGPCPVCGGTDRFHVRRRSSGAALVGCRGCIDGQPASVRSEQYVLICREVFGEEPGENPFLPKVPAWPAPKPPPAKAQTPSPVARPKPPDRDQEAVVLAQRLWSAGKSPEAKPVRAYLNRRHVWPDLPDAPALPAESMRWLAAAQGRQLLPLARGKSPWPEACAGVLMYAFKDVSGVVKAVSLEGLKEDGGFPPGNRFRRTYGRRLGAYFTPEETSGGLLLCEGELNALACISLGRLGRTEYQGREARAYGGTANLRAAALSRKRNAQVLVDGDPGGMAAAEKMYRANPSIRVMVQPVKHDVASLLAEEIEERISICAIEQKISDKDAARVAWAGMLDDPGGTDGGRPT